MPHDVLLTSNDVAEALSRAYVDAIAARVGYTLAYRTFDRDGVDIQIQAGGQMRPVIDVQLKATKNLGEPIDGFYKFPLKRRNFDLLRIETLVPRILVVLSLPEREEDWLHVTTDELVMRRSAFWVNLLGQPETANKETVTISIDSKNQFNIDSIKKLMDEARTGKIS